MNERGILKKDHLSLRIVSYDFPLNKEGDEQLSKGQ